MHVPRASLLRRLAIATRVGTIAAALLVGGSRPALAADEPPTEWDGLARVQSKRVGLLYLRPGASLSAYKRVNLDPAQVAFAKNWDPNRDATTLSQRMSKADIDAIKADLATEFRKVFQSRLAKGGYVLTDENGEDVLRVTPAIVDLYVNAPARSSSSRSRSYVADSGRMTLVAELRDSVTGQLIARAVDKQESRENFQVSSRVSNSGDAIEILTRWADALRKGLDDAREQPAAK
jgi:hypothetical protein